MNIVETTGLRVRVTAGRSTYCRGERAAWDVELPRDGLRGEVTLTVTAGSVVLGRDRFPAGSAGRLQLDTGKLRCGEYELVLHASDQAGVSIEHREALQIVRQPTQDGLDIWLWPHQAYTDSLSRSPELAREVFAFWAQHGFTVLGLPPFVEADRRDLLEQTLGLGVLAGLAPCGGIEARQFDEAFEIDETMKFQLAGGGQATHAGALLNPFDPRVVKRHEACVTRLLEQVRDYPHIAVAFFNSELVDSLDLCGNPQGVELMRQTLGFVETNPDGLAAPVSGVIADDDPRLLLRRFRFKQGDGLVAANARTATLIHRERPNVFTITDPYRLAMLLELFDQIDGVSTWTYTNPDPKLMLGGVETLRAASRRTRKTFVSTVTLLNYPGELDPTDRWMMMGPGRLAVTTWINLSRAPRMVGYYFSSVFDPFGALENDLSTPAERSDEEMPKASFELLTRLSREVFVPLGQVIRRLKVSPRRIAVLSSDTAAAFSSERPLLGYYPGMQACHIYSLLAMAQLSADIVVDEEVERYGLDGYDVLVMPRCGTISASVYEQVKTFVARGGVVVADEHLKAPLEGVIQFDTDLGYRANVTAQAIAKGEAYEKWDDHVDPEHAKVVAAEGVTALADQQIMEGYAEELRALLEGVATRQVDCDRPTALTNLCEFGEASYVFVINDQRTYDDRVGEHRAVLGQIEAQTARVTLCDAAPGAAVYDLVEHRKLAATHDSERGNLAFDVSMTDLGGTLIAVLPAALQEVRIAMPTEARLGASVRIAVTIHDVAGGAAAGVLPLHVTVTDPAGRSDEYSRYCVAENGAATVALPLAENDAPGAWRVEVSDLTAGLAASAAMNVQTKDN